MDAVLAAFCAVTGALNRLGRFLPQLALRAALAWEFWIAGQHKLHGADWLAGLPRRTPLPLTPGAAGTVWFILTWVELLGAVALLTGFGTRFAAFVLILLEAAAWFVLHATAGGHGGERPLLYMAMLGPLLFSGPGLFSLDHWVVRRI